jgi:hypothetical protein
MDLLSDSSLYSNYLNEQNLVLKVLSNSSLKLNKSKRKEKVQKKIYFYSLPPPPFLKYLLPKNGLHFLAKYLCSV